LVPEENCTDKEAFKNMQETHKAQKETGRLALE